MNILNLNNLFGNLIKDDKSDIQTLEVIHGDRSLLIAELKAGRKLPAHYHKQGAEIYQVLCGTGRIEVGELSADNTIIWQTSVDLKSGDVFEVQPQQVHRLSSGGEDLHLVFFTPPTHLGEDRHFL